MNHYKIVRLVLKNIEYHFSKPDASEIFVSIQDDIEILEINENEAKLNVERKLSFDTQKNSFINVNYEIAVECDEPIVKKNLQDEINSNHTLNLTVVYSKISLLISQITSMSPFGVIVTPPKFNPQNINVR